MRAHQDNFCNLRQGEIKIKKYILFNRTLIVETGVLFIFLNGTRAVLEERLKQREGHFIAPTLLDSQLDILEPPDLAESIQVDLSDTLQAQIEDILAQMEQRHLFGIPQVQ